MRSARRHFGSRATNSCPESKKQAFRTLYTYTGQKYKGERRGEEELGRPVGEEHSSEEACEASGDEQSGGDRSAGTCTASGAHFGCGAPESERGAAIEEAAAAATGRRKAFAEKERIGTESVSLSEQRETDLVRILNSESRSSPTNKT